jgi:hypothetical protein
MKIRFYLPEGEEIHEYSLGDIDIYNDDKVLSSSHNARHQMMIFISISDLSQGIESLLTNDAQKNYEFVGTDSSFQLLINRTQGKLSITSSNKKIMNTTHEELVQALWQCWKDTEKYTEFISHDSSVYLDMIDAKSSFQRTFANIIQK